MFNGSTKAFQALSTGSSPVIRSIILLEGDFQVNFSQDEIFLFIDRDIQGNDTASLQKDLAELKNPDLNDPRFVEALIHAVAYNQAVTTKMLLEFGVDPNVTNNRKNTPLFFACANGYTEICKILIEHGANVNARNNKRRTPFFANTIYGHFDQTHVETGDMLLKAGAKPNLKDTVGNTAIHVLCGSEVQSDTQLEALKFLISRGVKLNIKDSEEETPLHTAFVVGHYKLAKELIAAGADVNTKNRYGKTPLDYCPEEIKNVILKHLTLDSVLKTCDEANRYKCSYEWEI